MQRIMILIILLLFIGNITAKNLTVHGGMLNNIKKERNVEGVLPLYGYYCGLGHSNKYGVTPVDELDRACQIHDICTTAGLLACYCNEQLYWSVSNIKPLNNNMSMTKDSVLSYIYTSMIRCKNYDDFDAKYIIGGTNNKGFNYLPFYGEEASKYVLIKTLENDNIYFLTFDNVYDYSQFTQKVYLNPLIDISDDKKIKDRTYQKLSNFNLIYSTKNSTTSVHVLDITLYRAKYVMNLMIQEIEELEKNINVSTHTINNMNETINLMIQEIEELEKNINVSTHTINNMNETIRYQNQKIDDLEKAIELNTNITHDIINKINETIDYQNKEIYELEKIIGLNTNISQSTITKMEETIEHQNQEIRELNVNIKLNINASTNIINNMNSTIEYQNRKVYELEEIIEMNTYINNISKNIISKLNNTIQNLEEKIRLDSNISAGMIYELNYTIQNMNDRINSDTNISTIIISALNDTLNKKNEEIEYLDAQTKIIIYVSSSIILGLSVTVFAFGVIVTYMVYSKKKQNFYRLPEEELADK